MTVNEWEERVARAYGEPGSIITAALCAFVHEQYDPEATDAEQAAELYVALWRVKERLDRVLIAVDQVGRDAYQS